MPVVFRPIRSKESERRQWLVRLVASATLVNGLGNIGQPLLIPFDRDPRLITLLLPFELYHWSRSLTVAFGFLLAYLSLHLLHRRALAWWLAMTISTLALLTQLVWGGLWYTPLARFLTRFRGLLTPMVLDGQQEHEVGPRSSTLASGRRVE